MKISRYSNSKVFRHGPFWSSCKDIPSNVNVGPFERSHRIAAVRHPWLISSGRLPGRTGSALNARQYNSVACICWSQICMKRAKIRCTFEAPFLRATINSPSKVLVLRIWIWGDGAERCMWCRCFKLELNRTPLLGWIMHKMCRYTLYAETTLRSNDHYLYLNIADRKGRDTGNNKMEQRSQELDWDMLMSCMHSILCHQRG